MDTCEQEPPNATQGVVERLHRTLQLSGDLLHCALAPIAEFNEALIEGLEFVDAAGQELLMADRSIIGFGGRNVGKILKDLVAEADTASTFIAEEMENFELGDFACPVAEVAVGLIFRKLAPENQAGFLVELFRVAQILHCGKDVAEDPSVMLRKQIHEPVVRQWLAHVSPRPSADAPENAFLRPANKEGDTYLFTRTVVSAPTHNSPLLDIYYRYLLDRILPLGRKPTWKSLGRRGRICRKLHPGNEVRQHRRPFICPLCVDNSRFRSVRVHKPVMPRWVMDNFR